MAEESGVGGESFVLLESTDYGSDLSVSDTDSMQLVTGSSSGAQSRSSSVPLLDRLRSSGLSRKRKVRKNMPPLGKRRSKGGGKSAGPKSVTPSQRVGEFQGEMLTVSGRRLFCNACREELSTKRSIIVSHIKSEKHSNGKVKLTMKGVHEKDIAKALLKYNTQ